jgi:ferritin-like metal-binding protein YciE
VSELDGVWEVRRIGGLLPPLIGVRKEIQGTHGKTLLPGGAIGVPFDVVGLELHYRAPFAGVVDRLVPHDGGFLGHATYRRRAFGRFEMKPIRGGTMSTVNDQLIKHLDEAHAMEQNVLRMLDGMISSTDDAEMRRELEQHKRVTEQQAERLEKRLEAHEAAPSVIKEAGGILGALMKGAVDIARSDKAGRNARDGFATEHMEIASYELLERVAKRAGDSETAAVARQNRKEEREMARKISANWDKVVELTLSDK